MDQSGCWGGVREVKRRPTRRWIEACTSLHSHCVNGIQTDNFIRMIFLIHRFLGLLPKVSSSSGNIIEGFGKFHCWWDKSLSITRTSK